MKIASVIAAVLVAGCGGASVSGGNVSHWLVLQFPFGPGKPFPIQGTHSPGPLIDGAYLLVQTRRCGAANPVAGGIDTNLVIITDRSSDKDLAIVDCLKRTLPVNFSAAIGSGDRWSSRTLDRSKFADFETSSAITQSAR